MKLRYGVNPYQDAAVEGVDQPVDLPFKILSGDPSYTNIMDALLGWQLVHESKISLGCCTATSFKHLSPVGVSTSKKAKGNLSVSARTCQEARDVDPLSSYGDIIAISDNVDISVAKLLRNEFSDGIVAPSYDREAIDILKNKKNGKYLILKIDDKWLASTMEVRDIFGTRLKQERNDLRFFEEMLLPVTKRVPSPSIMKSLVLGLTTLKYTQSNSVCFVSGGRVVGVGAGQQNRVDCIISAGKKAEVFKMRGHPCITNLPFKKSIKKRERINATTDILHDRVIKNSASDYSWKNLFKEEPINVSKSEKSKIIRDWSDLCMVSDGFLPFKDNIFHAIKYGAKYIAQPGGSIRDEEIIKVCDENGIAMVFTGKRIFTH